MYSSRERIVALRRFGSADGGHDGTKSDSTRPIGGTAQTKPAISDELRMRISDWEVGPWSQCLVDP